MEENTNPQSEQSKEALDRAAKRRQLEERRAAYYKERIKRLEEEQARKLQEEQRRAQEAKQKADHAKQKMLSMMRQRRMMNGLRRAA